MEIREFKIHVYGKRQTANVRFRLRISRNEKEADKTVQNNSYGENWLETTYFWVEVINTKRKLRGKVGHVLQINVCHLAQT